MYTIRFAINFLHGGSNNDVSQFHWLEPKTRTKGPQLLFLEYAMYEIDVG